MGMKFSIRTKLAFLLFAMGLVPLFIIIAFYCITGISNATKNANQDGILRNTIVQEHLTEHFERNFSVLRAVALNPMTKHYIEASEGERDTLMEETLFKTNEIFHDVNNMIITDSMAKQLYRTDGYPLVDITLRAYFGEAMAGREAVSPGLISLSNQRLITVVEVPVFSDGGKPIGLVQRDYDLEALQEFVTALADDETRVLVIDNTGSILAHSRLAVPSERDSLDDEWRPFVENAIAGNSGTTELNVNGERVLATYAKNALTNWTIVTERPYRFIKRQVLHEAFTAAAIGVALLFLIALIATFLSEKATRKLRIISNIAEKIANGSVDDTTFAEIGDDELGQMALAINKIRSSRDNYRKDAEIDMLTQLLNKATTERLCRSRLASNREGVFAALIIIDLDHFKEVNDTKGHQAGDTILREFADGLKRLFRPDDYVGRFGGDEFVVFINNLPGKEIAIQKAQAIQKLATSIMLDEENAGISASIGISSTPLHGTDYDSLFKAADIAVYKVKESGRNGYCYSSAPA